MKKFIVIAMILSLVLIGSACSSVEETSSPEPAQATENTYEPMMADVDEAQRLSSEAVELNNEIIDLASNSAGQECVAIQLIRTKLDRVWEIIEQLDEMTLPNEIIGHLEDSRTAVSNMEIQASKIEEMCGL